MGLPEVREGFGELPFAEKEGAEVLSGRDEGGVKTKGAAQGALGILRLTASELNNGPVVPERATFSLVSDGIGDKLRSIPESA